MSIHCYYSQGIPVTGLISVWELHMVNIVAPCSSGCVSLLLSPLWKSKVCQKDSQLRWFALS